MIDSTVLANKLQTYVENYQDEDGQNKDCDIQWVEAECLHIERKNHKYHLASVHGLFQEGFRVDSEVVVPDHIGFQEQGLLL